MPPHQEADDRRRPAEVDRAYPKLAPRLERIVTRCAAAPRPVVEEACQFAWSRLLDADPPIAADVALSWLATTALREARRQLRATRAEVSLDDGEVLGEVIQLPARGPAPDQLAEMRERLGTIHALPTRQQRMVWLQGAGYRYPEIAAITGDSRRTVERQLSRAKARLEGRRSA